jgi:integrase
MTVTEYLDEWIELQRFRLQPGTWGAYRQTIACYLAPAFGDTPLDGLDPMLLEQMYAGLLVHGGRGGRRLALGTIRYIHAVLHKALADAVRTGLLQTNVGDRVALPRRAPERTNLDDRLRVWTAAQVRSFLRLTRDDPHHDLWAVALGTGMRRGELLGLRWQDVVPDQRTIRVATSLTMIDGQPRLKTTKTNHVRRLHVDAHTAAAIERQHRRGVEAISDNELDLVFAEESGQPLIPQRITHRFRRLVRSLPLPTIRLHDVRHTHATLLLQAGVISTPLSAVRDGLERR